jgi:hypothetical protein
MYVSPAELRVLQESTYVKASEKEGTTTQKNSDNSPNSNPARMLCFTRLSSNQKKSSVKLQEFLPLLLRIGPL